LHLGYTVIGDGRCGWLSLASSVEDDRRQDHGMNQLHCDQGHLPKSQRLDQDDIRNHLDLTRMTRITLPWTWT